MDFGRRNILGLCLCAMVLAQCRKVPFSEDYGTVQLASGHWFENEGVAYVFFSLNDRQGDLERGVWELSYSYETEEGGVATVDFQEIDFSQGVHQHSLVACGATKICGSYSFSATRPLIQANIRYFYDRDSPLSRAATVSVQNHQISEQSSSYSAIPYGVFDEANEHFQLRIHHNFGSPGDDEIAAYGMTRRFTVAGATLTTISVDDYETARDAASSNFAFPSTLCDGAGTDTAKTFAGRRAWVEKTFSTDGAETGVCASVDFLDQSDNTLLSTKALGMKNPIVATSNYTFNTPLKSVYQIRTVISYCGSESSVTDPNFFDYQRFILGMPGRDVDVCFDYTDLESFEDDVEAFFDAELASALAAASGNQDVIFVITYHQVLSQEFYKFHQRLAGILNTMVNSHAERVSPRLVGAFVYDTSSSFRPTTAQAQNLMWCPQELDDVLIPIGTEDIGSANCLSSPATDLDLEVINFVAPLGPFPSLENYTNYVEEYGDSGIAKNPELIFRSAPTTASSRQEREGRITFFDGERITLGAGESMHVCPTRDFESYIDLFPHLKFRYDGLSDSTESLSIEEVSSLWSENDEGGEYDIGIVWDLPFWGAMQYTSTLTGNVLSAIPFQQSSKARESVGDDVWTRSEWKIGEHLQHCRKYCDHPTFDAQGVYQPQVTWRELNDGLCTEPSYPVYEEGA